MHRRSLHSFSLPSSKQEQSRDGMIQTRSRSVSILRCRLLLENTIFPNLFFFCDDQIFLSILIAFTFFVLIIYFFLMRPMIFSLMPKLQDSRVQTSQPRFWTTMLNSETKNRQNEKMNRLRDVTTLSTLNKSLNERIESSRTCLRNNETIVRR